MFEEKRPTCVTVIGWAWIIVGGLMCLSATMGLFTWTMMVHMAQDDPNMPGLFRVFPLLAVGQIGVGILGIISGANFLKLKAWARAALEGLSWLLLVLMIAFIIFWEATWISMGSGNAPAGFTLAGAVMGLVVSGVYAVPLGIMLRYLRGNRVREAVSRTPDPDGL